MPLIQTDMSVGERIAAYRMYKGLTQEVCAGLVGKSLSWWKKVEQGVRHVEKLSDLILICQVLGVRELGDLTGVMEYSLALDQKRDQPMLPDLRQAILVGPGHGDSNQSSVEEMRTALDHARATFHRDRLFVSHCGLLIPPLINGLTHSYRRADDQRSKRTLAGMLSELYVLTCQVLRDAGDFNLAWTAADRASSYAREADDPVVLAWAAWEASGVLKDLGSPDEGLAHCLEAVGEMRPLMDAVTDHRLSAYGELHGQAALMAAHCADEPTAMRLWDAGVTAYGSVSANYRNPITAYGREGAQVILVWINAALGKHRATIAAADSIDVTATPSRPLQALWLINTAKGYAGNNDDVATLHMLTRAEGISPEIVARNVHVREMIRQMLRRDRATIRADLHNLARNVGLLN